MDIFWNGTILREMPTLPRLPRSLLVVKQICFVVRSPQLTKILSPDFHKDPQNCDFVNLFYH